MQELRHRAEWDALVEHVLQFHIAPRHGVADDDEVRVRLQVLRVKRLATGIPEIARKSDMGG